MEFENLWFCLFFLPPCCVCICCEIMINERFSLFRSIYQQVKHLHNKKVKYFSLNSTQLSSSQSKKNAKFQTFSNVLIFVFVKKKWKKFLRKFHRKEQQWVNEWHKCRGWKRWAVQRNSLPIILEVDWNIFLKSILTHLNVDIIKIFIKSPSSFILKIYSHRISMKKREDESDDVQGANIYACKSCFLTLLVIPLTLTIH